MARLGDLVVTIGAATKSFDKALGDSMRKLRNFGKNTKQLGKSMSMSITMPIAALGAAAIKSAADLEAMETSFISLTGGAKQAADMMRNLNAFTAKTPFQIEEVAKSARQLIASGSGIDEVNEQLQFLGDIAATSGQPIDEIAAIFAKVNAKGKVELENLNQLAERGIPIFTALSEATGLPADKLGAGAVSVEQFNATLQSFSKEGGFAAGAMQRLSETAAGKFSTALDNLKLAGAAMAESLMPVLKQMLDRFTGILQSITQLSPETKKYIVIIAGIAAALGPLLVILPSLGAALTLMTGPIGLTIAALALLATGIYYFAEEVGQALAPVINWFIELYNESTLLRLAIGHIRGTVKVVFSFFGLVINQAIEGFKDLGAILKAIFTGDFAAVPGLVADAFTNATARIAEFGRQAAEEYTASIQNELNREPIELITPESITNGIKSLGGLKDIFDNMFSGGGAGAPAARPANMSTMSRVTGGSTAAAGLVTGTGPVTALAESMGKLRKEFSMTLDLSGQVEGAFVGLGMAIGGLVAGTITFGEVFAQSIAGLASLLIDIGQQFIAAGVAATAFYASLMSNPPAAIAAGVALVAVGAAIRGLQGRMEASPPALAKGGLAFGETMALVGDNPNAGSDPEVIAPLSKLQGMLGTGQAVTVTGRISGRDILLSNDRGQRARARYGGY